MYRDLEVTLLILSIRRDYVECYPSHGSSDSDPASVRVDGEESRRITTQFIVDTRVVTSVAICSIHLQHRHMQTSIVSVCVSVC